jgi:hypothetical protein
VGPTRRVVLLLSSVALLAAAMLGVTSAGAQQDEDDAPEAAPQGTDPATLLERLDALDLELPGTTPPVDVEVGPETTWGTLEGDPGSVRAVLETLESDLRRLFVDADDADGPVADAIATVARGWLDVWQGTAALATWETHDLAFPREAVDAAGIATGADELYGQAEKGLELVLLGRGRHLEGYGALVELAEATPDAQARIDVRASEAAAFDEEIRPRLALLLSRSSTGVLVAVERFETSAPGVEPRATSLELVCVDRALFETLGPTPTPEELDAAIAATPDRVDCPGLDDLPEVQPTE